MKARLAAVLLLIGILSASTVSADSLTVEEVADELICQCGCGMVLSECSHAVCSSRDTMTASIEAQIAQGRSKGEIVQSFVDYYGERVLSSPTKQGFNLMLWITPFAALLMGGAVVWVTLKKWVRRGQYTLETEEGEEDGEYRQRVEQELKEFKRR